MDEVKIRMILSESSSGIEEEVEADAEPGSEVSPDKMGKGISEESRTEDSMIAEVLAESVKSAPRRSNRLGLKEAKRKDDDTASDDEYVGLLKGRYVTRANRVTKKDGKKKKKNDIEFDSENSENPEDHVESRRSARNTERKNYGEMMDNSEEETSKKGTNSGSVEQEGSTKRKRKYRTKNNSSKGLDDSEFLVHVDSELSSDEDYSGEDLPKPKLKVGRPPKKQKLKVEGLCILCGIEGASVACNYCPKLYHSTCVTPPLTSKSKGYWKCPYCKCERLEKVKSILTWRVASDEKREFFVHFQGKSFWQCQWVPEFQLKVWQPILLRCYYKKYGMKSPPDLDEGDARRLRKNNQDPLEVRFYQFGIRPDWLRIHRIISEKNEGGIQRYFVKWQNLGYEWSTWEDHETCKEILDEFNVAVEKYKEWRSYFCSEVKDSTVGFKHVIQPPQTPTSDLNKKLDVQPEFIGKGLALHEYQLEGLNWLRYSWANGVNTILADEMGLGKTIQTIIFLRCLYLEGHSKGPFLISAPLSTVINWEREFELWAPELYVVVYTGADREARQTIRQLEFPSDPLTRITLQPHALKCPPRFHVLLTSYEYVNMDKPCLSSIPWSMIVIDEAHRLKNDSSLFFKNLSCYTTSYKLLLTGTPLQNNLEELFHLLNFLSPDKFHDIDKFTTEFQDIGKEEQVQKLHLLLGPHLLRRLKSDVLKDMPAKSELIVRVELSAMQKKISKLILTKNFKALNAKGGRQTSLQNVMMDLKKCCNHPYLFSAASVEAPETPEGLYEVEALTNASGKMKVMRKMLKVLKEQGHRVLIFCQMTKMMDIIEEFLEGEYYAYERIDGDTQGPVRQDAIDRFNAPGAKQFVFLLSTKAGGLGINLATADTVIIYDSDWNPHNDIQALSRAHRIGQQSKVMIYRFVTRNSVEEKIAQVCKEKLMLTHLVVRPGIGNRLFSSAEMESIIKFGTIKLFDKESEKDREIHYTDAAIEELLYRTQGDKEAEQQKETWINDYFSSFKVANYDVEAEGAPDEHPTSVEVQDDGRGNVENNDPNFWKSLVSQQMEKEKEIDFASYGKGLRRKKKISYCDTNKHDMSSTKRPGNKGGTAKRPNSWSPPPDIDLFSSPSSGDEYVPNQLHYLSSQRKRAMPYQPQSLNTSNSSGDLHPESPGVSSSNVLPIISDLNATSNTLPPSEVNETSSSSSDVKELPSKPLNTNKGNIIDRDCNHEVVLWTSSEEDSSTSIEEIEPVDPFAGVVTHVADS